MCVFYFILCFFYYCFIEKLKKGQKWASNLKCPFKHFPLVVSLSQGMVVTFDLGFVRLILLFFFSFLIFIFRSLVLGFFNIILENFYWVTRSLNGKKCGREESGCPRVAGLQKVEAKIVEISTCLIVVSCQCGKVHFSKAIH